ncbi:MAG TPA: acyltransferase [Chthoniobacteraceae bacterium]|jgi:acetyltransferase-like isoleucine patch superfamily enzyme
MLHPPTIWLSLLEAALSCSARIHLRVTGGVYQLCLLRMMGVTVQGPVSFAPGASFSDPSKLQLGRYVSFGANARIVSWAPVIIGDDFMASDSLSINSGDHDPITWKPKLAPITIGNRVWCGTGVTICAGVEIGDDVVIGAGSLVTKSLPAGHIAYGSPAKPMRAINREGEKLWSMWPERSDFHRVHEASKFKQRFHRFVARF